MQTFDKQFQQVQLLTIDSAHDGQRIDNYLTGLLRKVPKSLVYRLLRTGQVRINGKRAQPRARLQIGDEVRIPPVRLPVQMQSKASDDALAAVRAAVIFKDRNFLVLDKPSGMAAHGGSGIAHGAIELLRQAFPEEKLELAHRLDRDTSGVMVLARKRSALLGVQQCIREGSVVKQYLALMSGRPHSARFDVNAPLRKFSMQGGERMVKVAVDGKPALTFFRQVQAYADCSLMQVDLATGRTHQIRVHAQHVGLPLVGDDKYGQREVNRAFRQWGLKRLFLHASRFEFSWDGQDYCFTAALPQSLHEVLDKLPPR